MRLDAHELIGRHTGKPIIIMGNAWSLNAIPLVQMKRFVTIGCNRILRIFEPTYYICADRRPYCNDYKLLAKSKAKRLLSQAMFSSNNIGGGGSDPGPQPEPDFAWYPFQPISYLRREIMSFTDEELLPKDEKATFISYANIAPPMLEWAILMGGNPIGMVGLDMEYESREKSHFWGYGRAEGSFCFNAPRTAALLWRIVEAAERKKHIRSVNLSPFRGRMDSFFPHISFKDFCRAATIPKALMINEALLRPAVRREAKTFRHRRRR